MKRASFVLVLVTACRSQHAASVDAHATQVDAMAGAPSCLHGSRQLTAPSGATILELASDGGLLYLSTVSSTTGAISLETLPIAGGTPQVIASAVDDEFHLASFGDAIFYGAHLASTAPYELHQVRGNVDTILGAVPSITPIIVQANATDAYVLGTDATAGLTLWRVSRSGVTGTPPVVASVGNTGSPGPFALGGSVAAFTDSSGIEIVAIPGPSTPTSVANVDKMQTSALAFIGDTGFRLSEQQSTVDMTNMYVAEFTPSTTPTAGWGLVQALPDALFADANHLYLTLHTTTPSAPPNEPSAPALYVLAPTIIPGFQLCNFDPHSPSSPIAHDANNIYGVDGSTIYVVPIN
jgi:hypothetical protein